MKVLWIIVPLFLAGLLLGRVSTSIVSEEKVAPSVQPKAVTMLEVPEGITASTGDFFSIPPPGGTYTRAEMLALLEEGYLTNDMEVEAVVLREWAAFETEEGICAVFEMGNRGIAWSLLGEWAEHHPEKAAQIAFSIPSENRDEAASYSDVISTAMSQLLFSAPEAAVRIESQYSHRGHHGLNFQYSNLSEKTADDAKRALEAIAQFRNSWIADRAAVAILGAIYVDPEFSLEWIEEHIPGSRRTHAKNSILQNWARNDHESAAVYVAENLDGSAESQARLQTLIKSLGPSHPEFLIRWLKEQDREDLKKIRSVNWGYLTPELREKLTAQLGEEFQRFAPAEPVPAQSTATSWPPATREEAANWLRSYRNPPGLGPANWSIETINETLALKSSELSQASPADTRKIADNWASHDPVAAIEWAAQLPDHLMIETAETALATWFKNEPTAALEYVDEMPEGEFRSYAVERVSNDWLSEDAEAAVKWINDLPSGFSKDVAKREAALRFIDHNPKRSFFQSNWIGNDIIREETLERVFRSWNSRNPAEALEFIEKANVSEEVKAAARSHAEKNIEHRRRRDSK